MGQVISTCNTYALQDQCQQVKNYLNNVKVKNIYILLNNSNYSNQSLSYQQIGILLNIICILVRFCFIIFGFINLDCQDLEQFYFGQTKPILTRKNKNIDQFSSKNVLIKQEIKKSYSTNQINRNTINQSEGKNKKLEYSMKNCIRMNSSQIEMSERLGNQNNQIVTSLNNQKGSSYSNNNKLIDYGQYRYKKQIQHLIRQNNQLKNHFKQEQAQFKNKQLKLKQKQKQNNHLLEKYKNIRCYTQYFNGNILNINNKEQSQWFVNSLESSIQYKIKRTLLLYRYDNLNKQNVHSYIDDHSYIVLLTRLTNGQIIGAYSVAPFKEQIKDQNQFGCLFSFKKRKIFPIKKKCSSQNHSLCPVLWDRSYIIWGNSDIRISLGLGQTDFYSNFGTLNSFYQHQNQSQKCTVEDLLLSSNRHQQFQTYEIYQVQFQQQ